MHTLSCVCVYVSFIQTTLTVLHSYYQSGRGELLVGHNSQFFLLLFASTALSYPDSPVTSQSLTINEGMMFTSPEIVWNSEPKQIG